MPFTVWRNFTTRVPVSGTVSVLIVLKSLVAPFDTGAVREGNGITGHRLIEQPTCGCFWIHVTVWGRNVSADRERGVAFGSRKPSIASDEELS